MRININKKTKILAALAALCMLITSWIVLSREDSHEGIIRLHVIANSDSAADQKLKLQVRDEVLKLLSKKMVAEVNAGRGGELDVAESRKYIKDNFGEIKKTAEEVMREKGYTYSADATLGVRWIPEKSYGGVYFPAGNYEALNVTLGEGKGENWWCVLFPPLCLIDASDSEAERRELVRSLGIKDKEKIENGRIIVRSKLAELLGR